MENNFVDTSGADYAKNFNAPEVDFESENFFDDQDDDDNVNVGFGPDDRDDDFEDFDDNYEGIQDNNDSTGNEVLDSYVNWASERGIDVTKQGIDPEIFDQEQMDKLVGKYYIQKELSNVDPRITELAENGVSLDEYMEHKNYLNSLANQDPVQLFKAAMYDHLLKSEANIGGISVDRNGNPDEKSTQYLVNEVERRVQAMDPEQIKQRGTQIQNSYRNQANELPQHLIEQQKQKQGQELQRYNSEVEELTSLLKDKFSKSDNLIIDFSGQAEKDDFIGYMKQNLSLQNVEGQTVVPLLYKLQNDADFLSTTMRLLHMHEKGYFTDMKNKERNAAFKKLSVTPVLGKNNKSNNTGGSGKFVDTSDPNYIKKFKR